MRNDDNYRLRLVTLIALLLLLGGCAAHPPDFQTMLQNLSRSYPNLWRLVTATAYVLGWALCLKALYNLKIYGEARTMMSSSTSIKTPLAYFLAAAGLIFSPTAFHDIMKTTFGYTSPLQYSGGNLSGWSVASTYALIGLIQFIGLLAFIRGWIYIARAGEQGGQPGTVAKGLTHLIGGILAINIIGTRNIIWNTFGF